MDFADFFNSLFSGVSSLLFDIINAILFFIAQLVKGLVFIWNGVQILAKYALKALVSGLKFFKHIWENGLKPLFAKIGDIIGKVHKWLEDHLRPIINWIKKAQKWLEAHVWKPLRAYIQFLQRIRRWLAILRFLHIKWAEKLDRRLARAEAETARVFLEVRQILNTVIGWVNAASDPLRLGRMVLFAAAGRRMAGAICRLFTGLPLGVFFPHTGKGAHLWEEPIVHARELDDPRRNPPASQILLGLTPLPDSGFESTDPTPSDEELDSAEPAAFFSDYGDYLRSSEVFFDGLDTPRISITDTINEKKGNLAEAGKVIGDFLRSAVQV